MNIFALSRSPKEAAREMIDKHVIKMPTESCQMLHTNALFYDYLDDHGEEPTLSELKQYHRDVSSKLMIPAMLNHPSTVWARNNRSNFKWLFEHALALCKEYTYRYGREHGARERILDVSDYSIFGRWQDADAVTIAMDNKYRLDRGKVMHDNPWDFVIKSYRHYYLEGKWRIAEWRMERQPEWWPTNHIKIKWNIEFDAMEKATGMVLQKYKIEE